MFESLEMDEILWIIIEYMALQFSWNLNFEYFEGHN